MPRARAPSARSSRSIAVRTPVNLIESELFGHEKGAFTGAFERHLGKLIEGDGATIFIDEITAIPADLQAKLARFLETGMARPIGARHGREVDIRVINRSEYRPA